MDLDSWTPRDVTRRVSIIVGTIIGSFFCTYLNVAQGWYGLWAFMLFWPVAFGFGWICFALMQRSYGEAFK
jgi:hypothetical protein